MLDKAILILSIVYSGAGGELSSASMPLEDFRALPATECVSMREKAEADWKLLVEANKEKTDDQGRTMMSVTVQCYPVSRQEFAIFSSTFGLPD